MKSLNEKTKKFFLDTMSNGAGGILSNIAALLAGCLMGQANHTPTPPPTPVPVEKVQEICRSTMIEASGQPPARIRQCETKKETIRNL